MQLVPKPNSKNMYCNACKDKYDDYLDVNSISLSIFSPISIKRKFKIIFLMIIFLSCRINTRIVDQRWSSKKNKSHSPLRPPMWLWLMNLPKLNSYPGQPKRWNMKKLANKKTPTNKTRTLFRKIKIWRIITSFMTSCSIDSETHTGIYFNWTVKIFTIMIACLILIFLIRASSTTTLYRIIWSYINFHMCCSTTLITTSAWE